MNKDTQLTVEEALDRLDAISADPEGAHQEADSILLMVVDPVVAEAYERVVDRCRWWAYA